MMSQKNPKKSPTNSMASGAKGRLRLHHGPWKPLFFSQLYGIKSDEAQRRINELSKQNRMRITWTKSSMHCQQASAREPTIKIRAFVNDPKVVFLDDPRSVFDVMTA